MPKRPLADILIGAFALRFDGLLTRNETDFRSVFSQLTIVSP
ncbi:MAG: type II toxin-antitoxin system VapC family toxin [Verrucomicrobia bacterium]|nr:type II toxin-antitoxin system VapC family toxin [Verrucomicrobiota bacterium]